MNHRATPRFWACYRALPAEVQQLADRCYELLHLPPGLAHSFRNESDAPARMIITVTPAGLEEMFFEVGTPLAEGATTALQPMPEEIERLLEAAPRYGVEILAK